MRKLFIIFITISLAACSKDEFNPSKPKNGQKAELFIDHYSDVRDRRVFLLPDRTPSPLSLGGFEGREPGYTYKVKAKVYISPQVVMDDGVNSWFEYVEVISKEKYTGTESFEIGLVYPWGFESGGGLAVSKEGERFKYGGGGNLRAANEAIKQQLESFISREKEIGNTGDYREYREYLRKLALRAVVSHDPENWGKGYLVHEIKYSQID